ncbi:hypothetical protein CEP52_014853 [Fusarium oligoseptatum]|uniref:Uncharacterized protein n=1 Tax=Fusarium oligoseptatum TaxID=2604345 RepID=A0A428SIL3_9HYPO|nr:hypothetical protein CEP52_014853 [Fusarium oligoseptatum]
MLTRSQFVQRQTEQFHYEEPYTDGFIYSKLREHIVDSSDYHSWLIDFPGLIDALKLGNFRKYSAWGLFNEANICLRHIHGKWSGYTRGNRSVQRCLTPQTVELLEGRAPAVSQSDHEWVRAVFRTRMVFSEITDQQQRDELEKGILRTSGMIPSLRLFQANMLYLGIAAQIIWSLLVPSELRKTAKGEGSTALQSALRECWVETEPYVEIREGEFQPVLGPPSFDLAYNTVMVAALRQFAYMAREGPKIERGEPALRLSTDDVNSCESLFQRRAKLLGFRNYLIDQGAAKPATQFSPEKHVLELGEDSFFSRTERRCGRPFARVFPIIQEVAFLPRLLEEGKLGTITEAFILKDLVRSFLPRCSFNFDLSRRSIHINGPALGIERQLVYSGHGESMSVDLNREVNMDQNDYHILNVESTGMDVDTPMASPVAPMFEDEDEDEDVPMEDLFFEPAVAEETEDSDFWEQLLLEYQTNAGTTQEAFREDLLSAAVRLTSLFRPTLW